MITPGDKLYVVVRGDLPAGSQIAQACHGMRQFGHEHPLIEGAWFRESNYIAILNARNEEHIERLIAKCLEKDVPYSIFREPDLGDSITCLVVCPGPSGRKICSSLPLALKECKTSIP
jgi:hypothetical protein